MAGVDSLPAWRQLQLKAETFNSSLSAHPFRLGLTSTFNNSKFNTLLEVGALKFDFSHTLLDEETLFLLYELAKQGKLEQEIESLFSGFPVNFTENRAALHTALRDISVFQQAQLAEPYKSIHYELNRFLNFADRVRLQDHRGFSGQYFTDIVNIGVGGSSLGPELVTQALRSPNETIRAHFIDSLEPEVFLECLKNLSLEHTLFIFASKSFNTPETLSHFETLKKHWQRNFGTIENLNQHIVGISANAEAMKNYKIPQEQQFFLWDFIGGRFSVWSAIGLIAAITAGSNRFYQFLRGAHEIDQHFRYSPLAQNIPILLSLLDIWFGNFLNFPTLAILPYSSRLSMLAPHLQQLFMESLGKRVDKSGEWVNYHTGRIVWGGVGFKGQHAFFQLLHQGTARVQMDFIVPEAKNNPIACIQANAQIKALTQGSSDNYGNSLAEKHQFCPGQHPLTVIHMDETSPEALGALLALYEHRVFSQAAIWQINPFDQWGVELGKKIALQAST